MKFDRNPLYMFFPYMDKNPYHMLSISMMCELTNKIKIGLDSGAYTAFNKGTTVDLGNYMEYLHSLRKKPTIYIQLDVIGNRTETFDNLKTMYDNDLKPLPVFTPGMKLTDLDLLAKYNNYIAVGGIVGKPATHIAQYLDWLAPALRANKLRIHLLGVSMLKILSKYDFIYSADSTNYAMARAYDSIPALTETGNIIKLPTLAPKTRQFLRRKLYEYGISAIHPDGGVYRLRCLNFYLMRTMFQYGTAMKQSSDVRYYVGVPPYYLGYVMYAYGDEMTKRIRKWIKTQPMKPKHRDLMMKNVIKLEGIIRNANSYLRL